ncbi:MAG: type I restriction enzyme HsdR N-terminal domain-containing protein [Porphyromonas sp.]|nr:type I restriction enzyme HsdR N-terminal domain-containing protein [Porphyromonas sp.]
MKSEEKTSEDREMIYDPIRESWVADAPEERVRQAVTHFLVEKLGYPRGRLGNEYTIRVGKVSRRCDTVVFDPRLRPLMVIEYKAPSVKLNDQVVTQIFNYNSVLLVPVLVITNGKNFVIFKVGYGGEKTVTLDRLPTYQELLSLGV